MTPFKPAGTLQPFSGSCQRKSRHGGPEYSEHFTLPDQSNIGTCDDEGDGDYWFVRGDALFMVLDVMDENKWDDHEEFIADACEANPEVRWKLVFSHYSPYNSYEEYMEKGQEMRPYFLKFADRL